MLKSHVVIIYFVIYIYIDRWIGRQVDRKIYIIYRQIAFLSCFVTIWILEIVKIGAIAIFGINMFVFGSTILVCFFVKKKNPYLLKICLPYHDWARFRIRVDIWVVNKGVGLNFHLQCIKHDYSIYNILILRKSIKITKTNRF